MLPSDECLDPSSRGTGLVKQRGNPKEGRKCTRSWGSMPLLGWGGLELIKGKHRSFCRHARMDLLSTHFLVSPGFVCPRDGFSKAMVAPKGERGSLKDILVLYPPLYFSLSLSIYIYTHAVELKTGPRFGFFVLKTDPRVILRTGPSFSLFSPFFIVFWGHD